MLLPVTQAAGSPAPTPVSPPQAGGQLQHTFEPAARRVLIGPRGFEWRDFHLTEPPRAGKEATAGLCNSSTAAGTGQGPRSSRWSRGRTTLPGIGALRPGLGCKYQPYAAHPTPDLPTPGTLRPTISQVQHALKFRPVITLLSKVRGVHSWPNAVGTEKFSAHLDP